MIIDQDRALENVMTAVVEQAVNDWRALCNGAPETSDRNFRELTHFFKHDCIAYLKDQTVAPGIYAKLKSEREEAYGNNLLYFQKFGT